MDTDSPIVFNADNCLGEQSLDLEDIDISNCPALPEMPENARLGNSDIMIGLGAWELGQTAEGLAYKYGSLSSSLTTPRTLNFYNSTEVTLVNSGNLACWAKGYYRLRKILQNPPVEYIKLHNAGFQVRFFQFQTDLRNGPTGFMQLASYRDHLIKWVTLIETDGTCVQPTLQKFKDYLQAELSRRGL